MFKVNNKNNRTRSLTPFWFFIVNFEHISHFCVLFLLFKSNNKIYQKSKCYVSKIITRNSLPKVNCKKTVLRDFVKLTIKHFLIKCQIVSLQLIRSKYRIEQIKMDFVCVQYWYLAFNFNECLRNLANLWKVLLLLERFFQL